MRDLAVLLLHLLATVARLAGPGGVRSVVAESVLVKHQLLILNRSRTRSPNLRLSDRIVAGVCALLMRPGRLVRSAIVLKPSTLLSLHRALTKRKYRLLFSPRARRKPGRGRREWIRECFLRFQRRFGGAQPSGVWAEHFSIICWPTIRWDRGPSRGRRSQGDPLVLHATAG